jgi:mRNA interferase HigB
MLAIFIAAYPNVAWINYTYRVMYIRFIGAHKQYDAIGAHVA